MTHDLHEAVNRSGDGSSGPAKRTDTGLFADVWRRPGLAPRERSIAALAALVPLDHSTRLPLHPARARGNGPAYGERAERVTHLADYAGEPCAFSAVQAPRGTSTP